MFHFLKGKSKENVLYAPCKGKVVPLSEVPDPTFSEKILGDGFAVIPSEGKIYAPASKKSSCPVVTTVRYAKDNKANQRKGNVV